MNLYQIQARTLAGLAAPRATLASALKCAACPTAQRAACPRNALAGGLGCAAPGGACGCKKGLGDTPDTTAPAALADYTGDTTGGAFDWHYVIMGGLAAVAVYLAWPNPERDLARVRTREARRAYFDRLAAIERGETPKKKGGRK